MAHYIYETEGASSGLFETKDAELGFLMMALCAIVGDAYRNIIHGYQLRPKSA